jgi:hypothetical protein
MSDFVDKLRLKEAAEEDLYFAEQDLKLIRALHEKKLSRVAKRRVGKDMGKADVFPERCEEIPQTHKKKPRSLLRACRRLLDDIRKVCKRSGRD